MRGKHYPRQDRMEATAALHASGQKRTRKPMTAREQAYDEALRAYGAARKEAQATGGKLPNMGDFLNSIPA